MGDYASQIRDPLLGMRWLVKPIPNIEANNNIPGPALLLGAGAATEKTPIEKKTYRPCFGCVCRILRDRKKGQKYYQVHWLTTDTYDVHLHSRILMFLRPKNLELLNAAKS